MLRLRWRPLFAAIIAAAATGVVISFVWQAWLARPFAGSSSLGYLTPCTRVGLVLLNPTPTHTWPAVTRGSSPDEVWIFETMNDITTVYVRDTKGLLRHPSGEPLFTREQYLSPQGEELDLVAASNSSSGPLQTFVARQLAAPTAARVATLTTPVEPGTLSICNASDANMKRNLRALEEHFDQVHMMSDQLPGWKRYVASPGLGVMLAGVVAVSLLALLWLPWEAAARDAARTRIHRRAGASSGQLARRAFARFLGYSLVTQPLVIAVVYAVNASGGPSWESLPGVWVPGIAAACTLVSAAFYAAAVTRTRIS